jgi:hypothetical protein
MKGCKMKVTAEVKMNNDDNFLMLWNTNKKDMQSFMTSLFKSDVIRFFDDLNLVYIHVKNISSIKIIKVEYGD